MEGLRFRLQCVVFRGVGVGFRVECLGLRVGDSGFGAM